MSATLVADIVPGLGSSSPRHLTAVNGTLYFGASDPSHGVGLWKSDGTAAGTVFVKALPAYPEQFTPVGATVFFSTGSDLWKTDGTRAGTVRLRTLESIAQLTAASGKLFFSAWGGSTTGQELYASDGTKGGTRLVKDLFPGIGTAGDPDARSQGARTIKQPNSSGPQWLTDLNGALFFTAFDGATVGLWRSDGTTLGTTRVSPQGWSVQDMTAAGGVLYFGAAGAGVWGLGKSDGTTAGTTMVKAIGGPGVFPNSLTEVNGTIYFVADDGIPGWDLRNGRELWKSDGTADGTVLVKDIAPGSDGSHPRSLTDVNGTLFFTATTPSSGRELWQSDGTSAGTFLVLEINPGAAGSSPTQLTDVNGLLYFGADDGVAGTELWQSDGTAPGTRMVQDIYPGSEGSGPAYLTGMNHKLYFAASDPEHGRELWDPPPVEPTSEYLVVADWGGDKVLRYDGATGAFVDTFVPRHSGGLNQSYGILFGPDGNRDGRQDLYVSTGEFGGPGQLKGVLRYDGVTGAFIDEFTRGGDLQSPQGIIFGPDGHLYVATGTGGLGGRIARYDGRTGEFLGDFVPALSGGLRGPDGIVFGPAVGKPNQLDLYVSSAITHSILRYDGTTGAFLGEFVTSGSGGLERPQGLTFGTDGNLYVASFAASTGSRAVLRFQGASGPTPGAFLDRFVPPGRGGLTTPFGLIFGPDGNDDGQLDLYVANSDVEGNSTNGKNATVKRYDGVTGAFIDTFVTARSGGLDDAGFLTFTQTDPVTLAYTGQRLTPAVVEPATHSGPAQRPAPATLTAPTVSGPEHSSPPSPALSFPVSLSAPSRVPMSVQHTSTYHAGSGAYLIVRATVRASTQETTGGLLPRASTLPSLDDDDGLFARSLGAFSVEHVDSQAATWTDIANFWGRHRR